MWYDLSNIKRPRIVVFLEFLPVPTSSHRIEKTSNSRTGPAGQPACTVIGQGHLTVMPVSLITICPRAFGQVTSTDR
jgi:hypothetical protein